MGRGRPARRDFYERVYQTPAWTRSAQVGSGGEHDRFSKVWYRAVLEYILPRLALEGKRVLEVGAGYGYVAETISSCGAAYIGVDIAWHAISQIARRPGATIHGVVADGVNLPFPTASVDAVLCLEAMPLS
jgi:SAM-dependent methyltransferase